MQTLNFIGAAASFLGGWCGSVPISVIIWYILHHHGPPPPPDPWWKITIVGTLSGLVLGVLINTALLNSGGVNSSLLVSIISGVVGGVVGSSFVAKGTLSSLNKQ